MDPRLALGFHVDTTEAALAAERATLLQYINLKLAANGLPVVPVAGGTEIVDLARGLLTNFREKNRLLENYRCPVDRRIEAFLNEHFSDLTLEEPLRVPGRAIVLDRHGLARELSLPADGDRYENELVESYRVANGVLHNPRSDRRTTVGTFHVCAGGLPVPADKRVVARRTFVELLRNAMHPPRDLLRLPFTSNQQQQDHTWAAVLLRPIVCPAVHGYCPEKSMEVRFFAPGALVSNLDFVESIFGNAGDPHVPENDAGLDVEHWTGHTGCVILAPHLTRLTKRECGLPHVSQATERERRDRQCWEQEDELYNDGDAFKVTCRTEAGVIVTLIADNYFGYCKKEVKTQISYAANLLGGVEEEHAGGAVVFPSFNLGEEFQFNSRRYNGRTFDDVVRDYGEWIDVRPEGYGVDRRFPDLVYIAENALADLREQQITWEHGGSPQSIPLLPGKVYMAPSGYKLRTEKHPQAPTWRLIGTAGEGVFCHKPATVSGGGKSEISKSVIDYMQYGPIFVADFQRDLDAVEAICGRDFSTRWTPEMAARQDYVRHPSRAILDPRRSLGSVIKLLTPSDEYNDEYNQWLGSIPNHVYALLFAIKRFHQPEWGDDWMRHFSVDYVNGSPGHELKLRDRRLVGTYLRVGLSGEHGWKMFKVRQDFAAAAKLQTEDDISASITVPGRMLPGLNPEYAADSVKFAVNCEYRLFQRPDDAIHRGLDRQAESDLARRGVNFISNFEPLTRAEAGDMLDRVVDFDAFTPPMKQLLSAVRDSECAYVVCSDNPRRIDGQPSKNPRYLQDRPDLARPMDRYVAEMGTRLFRKTPAREPVRTPVHAVLSGRRNNPPDRERGIRGLAVYNPLHYQELPELFMDSICSLTGKSPSTTGFGSEGALTKGPFNSLRTTADLNAALVSAVLTGLAGYSTAAGYVGPHAKFEHDISLLIPEIWCRMSPEEQRPEFLIRHKLLEPLADLDEDGGRVLASRLGYRITAGFVRRFFGRVFDNPDKVFDEAVLRPETQDRDAFIDGVRYICEAQQSAAQQFFEDGSIDEACPPLRALLGIMAHGDDEGLTERDPELRRMFTRESVVESDWYAQRLRTQQKRHVTLWERHLAYLEAYPLSRRQNDPALDSLIASRREMAVVELDRVRDERYLDELVGTIGAQPLPGDSPAAAGIARENVGTQRSQRLKPVVIR